MLITTGSQILAHVFACHLQVSSSLISLKMRNYLLGGQFFSCYWAICESVGHKSINESFNLSVDSRYTCTRLTSRCKRQESEEVKPELPDKVNREKTVKGL